MHTLVIVGLPALAVAGVVFVGGWIFGNSVATRRILHSLKHDRGVGLAVIEDLAERWGVKIEKQETPGGP